MLESQQATSSSDHHNVDIDDLLDDPELERLHAERLYALQKEVEKRAALQRKGHGELQEVEEGQFLQVRWIPDFQHIAKEQSLVQDSRNPHNHCRPNAAKFLRTAKRSMKKLC